MTARKSQRNKKRATRAKHEHIDKKCVPVVIVEPEIVNSVIKKMWKWVKAEPIKHLQNLVKTIKTW